MLQVAAIYFCSQLLQSRCVREHGSPDSMADLGLLGHNITLQAVRDLQHSGMRSIYVPFANSRSCIHARTPYHSTPLRHLSVMAESPETGLETYRSVNIFRLMPPGIIPLVDGEAIMSSRSPAGRLEIVQSAQCGTTHDRGLSENLVSFDSIVCIRVDLRIVRTDHSDATPCFAPVPYGIVQIARIPETTNKYNCLASH
jgi:hypothetical protein